MVRHIQNMTINLVKIQFQHLYVYMFYVYMYDIPYSKAIVIYSIFLLFLIDYRKYSQLIFL